MSQRPERYCLIKATTLEDILETCNRNIKNANATEIDLREEGDGEESDFWYLEMHRSTWRDLQQDVEKMIAFRDSPEENPERYVCAIEVYRGQLIEGTIDHAYLIYKSPEEAEHAIKFKTGGFSYYHYIGKIDCSKTCYARLQQSETGYLRISKLEALQK